MTAIYQRELRSYFHGMTGYVFIAFLLVFAGIYTMFYNLSSGYPNFEYVLQAMAIIFLIAIPVLTMRVIAEERRQKTDQLLYTLPLGMTRVVLGKYLAMVTVVAVPCVVMAFYPLLLSTFGTVSFPTTYGALLGFFLLSAALSDGAAEENVLLSELSLLTQESVPEDADALIIYAPQSDISAHEKEMLLTYLQGGGKLLLVTDCIDTDLPNLAEVMAYYGASLVDGVVMEGDSSHHMRGSNYYLLPDIGSHNITTPLADGGYYVLMPVAQGISVSDELREGLTVTQLLTTTSASYTKAAPYNLTTYDKEEGDLEGPFALGVAISEEVEDGSTGIVWLTTSYMFNDDVDLLVSGANTDLFLNALDWMCQRESSISIRAKDLSTEYLTVPSADVSTWSLILVVTLPLAFILAGAYITVTRRKR